jgi:hypothetical protein
MGWEFLQRSFSELCSSMLLNDMKRKKKGIRAPIYVPFDAH